MQKTDAEQARAEEMTTEREARILEGAIATYGRRPQILKAVEELGELSTALARYLVTYEVDPEKKENVREEMADCYIMLNQLSLIFGDVTDWEIEKLERLEGRIRDAERYG